MASSKVQYNFEWDPNKARENIRKHKVSFEQAAQTFRDPLAISIFDEEHCHKEERWITLGQDNNGILLVVVHLFEEEGEGRYRIRIISARRATKREIKQYEG